MCILYVMLFQAFWPGEPKLLTATVKALKYFLHTVDILSPIQSEIQEQFTQLNRNLEDERYRRERLEEQINDLTELHQNEVPNIRQVSSLITFN